MSELELMAILRTVQDAAVGKVIDGSLALPAAEDAPDEDDAAVVADDHASTPAASEGDAS